MEQQNENKKERNKVGGFFLDGAKGITLGISAAIPGLSAGTIAVAESCYDTLIDAITSLRKQFKKSFLILLPYILGLLIGALAALIGIQKGYDAAPFSLTGLFAGFVFGSLPITFKELKKGTDSKEKTIHCLSFFLCLLVAGGIGVLCALTKVNLASYLQARVWWMYLLVLVAGILAAGACIVPGISGSMTLMVIGMYYPIHARFHSVIPPNGPSCGCDWGDSLILAATSYHSGGVNGLRADGSVAFYSDTIDCGNNFGDSSTQYIVAEPTGKSPYGVWGGLGSISGGESSSNP